MNRACLRSLPAAAVIAIFFGTAFSTPNYKQVQVVQVGYIQHPYDGVFRPCLAVSGSDIPTPVPVFITGLSTTEEGRVIRMAVTALEKGFYGVVDLQSDGVIYYSPYFAVQNVPVPGARPAALALPVLPGPPEAANGRGAVPAGRGGPTLPVRNADWRGVTVLQVQTLSYVDGSVRPCLTVTENSSSQYNVYVVGDNATIDDWGFQLALTALRGGLRAVIDHQDAPVPGVYYTPTVVVVNVPVP